MNGLQLAAVSSLEKVFSDQPPAIGMSVSSLSALRGERISFQIAYFWEQRERAFARIALTAPVKAHIRQVRSVPVSYPCHPERDAEYLRTKSGLYPDLLTEISEYGADLICGQWQSLWVELIVGLDAPKGIHEVCAEVFHASDKGLLGRVIIQLEIIDASLPPLHIPHTEWLHTDCLASYYKTAVFSEEYWRITGEFIRTAVKRDINMIYTPLFTPPLDTAPGGERPTVQLVEVKEHDGRYEFGFDLLGRWIELCRSSGVRYLEMSHLFTQWGAAHAPKIIEAQSGKRLFGWETDAQGTAYRSFLSQFMPQLIDFIRGRWDPQRVYFHVSDEPDLSQLSAYEAALNLLAPYLSEYQIIDALSDYAFYQHAPKTIPVCANNHIAVFLEKRPPKLWTYYCTAQSQYVSNRFMDLPSSRNRAFGLQLYRHKIDGILHWGYNFYHSFHSLYPIDPYRVTDAGGAFPSGDPFLVYPGAGGMPEESIRLMVLSEGLADLRALSLLESLIGADELERALDLSGIGFDRCPPAHRILQTRKELNRLIGLHS